MKPVETVLKMRQREERRRMEGSEFNYDVFLKNFVKCHNVLLT
jgi:hypothetical protein